MIVSEDDVRACLDLHTLLDAFAKVDLAIARWRRSKHSATQQEQLVELRIALESVLLSNDQGNVGEKRHRLAIRGAWFLGTTFADRKRTFDTLRFLYDYASSVVHAGNPKERSAWPLERTISEAQRLCREAILRVAHAQAIPKWTDIVLDRPPVDNVDPTN